MHDAYTGPLQVMDERELRTVNQPKRLGPERDPLRLVACRVVGGIDHVFGWRHAGRDVRIGDVIELPHVDAVNYQRIGRVEIV